MHLVFDPPIAPNPIGKGFYGFDKGRNVVASFTRDFDNRGAMHLTFRFDANQGLQPWKVRNVIELMAEANGAFLNPTVPLIDLLDTLLWLEMRFDCLEQAGLVAFERPQVVIATALDRLSCFFGC